MRALAILVLVSFVTLLSAATAHAQVNPADAAKGVGLLVRKGCTSCHSTDGTPRAGPTFRGLWGTKRTVITAGATSDTKADHDYLARAIRDPDADVVVGFPRGMMPKYQLSDADIDTMERGIHSLATADAPAPVSTASSSAMPLLAFFGAWFVGLHLLLSTIPVRKKLIAALKPGGFAGVYSLVAAIGLVGIILSFRSAPYVEVWLPPRALRWVPVLAMPVAILFMVAGFSTKSATSVGQGSSASDEDAAKGIFSITRHPALVGFAIWAAAHLLANGELRAILVFLAILALAVAGMLHIEGRRAAELGDAWTRYSERTSLVPFAAIARGRARLDLRGIGVVRVLASAFVYVAILHMHALVIGASPMP
jgi:uncharacterized membrane protein/cytochrome c551/c552